MSDDKIIHVGVACLIFKNGQVLLGKRVSKTHGNGEYGCGGGHAEYGENLSDAVRREIEEEWKIKISTPKFLCLTNIVKYGKHFIDVGFTADWLSGEPSPEDEGEFSEFDWYNLDGTPTPLFGAIPNYFESIKTGRTYFETIE